MLKLKKIKKQQKLQYKQNEITEREMPSHTAATGSKCKLADMAIQEEEVQTCLSSQSTSSPIPGNKTQALLTINSLIQQTVLHP